MSQTAEQTKLLYDVILEDLKSMSDVEIKSAENRYTFSLRTLIHIRNDGKIVVKYKNPVANIKEVKEKLAKNPAIGLPYNEKDDALFYQKVVGQLIIDTTSFGGKRSEDPVTDVVFVTENPV